MLLRDVGIGCNLTNMTFSLREIGVNEKGETLIGEWNEILKEADLCPTGTVHIESLTQQINTFVIVPTILYQVNNKRNTLENDSTISQSSNITRNFNDNILVMGVSNVSANFANDSSINSVAADLVKKLMPKIVNSQLNFVTYGQSGFKNNSISKGFKNNSSIVTISNTKLPGVSRNYKDKNAVMYNWSPAVVYNLGKYKFNGGFRMRNYYGDKYIRRKGPSRQYNERKSTRSQEELGHYPINKDEHRSTTAEMISSLPKNKKSGPDFGKKSQILSVKASFAFDKMKRKKTGKSDIVPETSLRFKLKSDAGSPFSLNLTLNLI